MVGPARDSLVPACPAIRVSNATRPIAIEFRWIASTHTEDGTTIYAPIHNEFHGDVADR